MIVALKYANGVVMATDSRVVYGTMPLMREQARKIEKVNENIGFAAAGLLGSIDKIFEGLKSQVSSVKSAPIEQIVTSCEDISWHYHQRYSERFEENTSSFPTVVLASHDRIFRIFSNGYSEEASDYCCEGSGRLYGEYILKGLYQTEMSENRAKELAVYTIMQTSIIDPNVGGDINLVTIDMDGFKQIPKEDVKEIINTINGRQEIMQKVWDKLSTATEEEKQKLLDLIKSIK
ncbi:MAG: hypothetical protein ACTSX6_14385 [Candidatus Heimdallarchaeaceae archaeon]